MSVRSRAGLCREGSSAVLRPYVLAVGCSGCGAEAAEGYRGTCIEPDYVSALVRVGIRYLIHAGERGFTAAVIGCVCLMRAFQELRKLCAERISLQRRIKPGVVAPGAVTVPLRPGEVRIPGAGKRLCRVCTDGQRRRQNEDEKQQQCRPPSQSLCFCGSHYTVSPIFLFMIKQYSLISLYSRTRNKSR